MRLKVKKKKERKKKVTSSISDQIQAIRHE